MSIATGPVRWHGLLALVGWAASRVLLGVAALLCFVVTRPRTAAGVAAGCAVWWLLTVHPVPTLTTMIVVAYGLDLYSLGWPASFRRRVTLRAMGWARSVLIYRRHWQPAMTVAELTMPGPDGSVRLPRLGRVRCGDAVDVVHIRALLGQRGADWEAAGPMLAHVFGARDVRVHRGDDRRLTLELLRGRRGRAWNRDRRLELEP